MALDLVLVLLPVVGVLLFMLLAGFWPDELTGFARKREDGEIWLPLRHNFWLRTPVDFKKIKRIGSDWIMVEGDPVKHPGFVLGVNLVPEDPQTLAGTEGTFYSNLCLDNETRDDFRNPILKQYFETVEYKLAEQRERGDEIVNASLLAEEARQTSQQILDELTDRLHWLYRAVKPGEFKSGAKSQVAEE